MSRADLMIIELAIDLLERVRAHFSSAPAQSVLLWVAH